MSVLVLLSGGVDSAVLLARAPEGSAALYIGYWQPAWRQEGIAAHRLAAHYGATLYRSALPDTHTPDGSPPLPPVDMSAPIGEEGPRVVPARNLMFIAQALHVAERVGLGRVWYGANSDDWEAYTDCRPRFVHQLNAALRARTPNQYAAKYTGPVVEAPLIHDTKRQVLNMARNLDVPLDVCWSCYTPRGGEPCGTCDSCKLRARATAESGGCR